MCSFTYVISGFWRVSNAVIAGDLARDLLLSPEVLGLLGGAFFYAFGLAQLPMGLMLDRFGPRIVISLLTSIGAASALVYWHFPWQYMVSVVIHIPENIPDQIDQYRKHSRVTLRSGL